MSTYSQAKKKRYCHHPWTKTYLANAICVSPFAIAHTCSHAQSHLHNHTDHNDNVCWRVSLHAFRTPHAERLHEDLSSARRGEGLHRCSYRVTLQAAIDRQPCSPRDGLAGRPWRPFRGASPRSRPLHPGGWHNGAMNSIAGSLVSRYVERRISDTKWLGDGHSLEWTRRLDRFAARGASTTLHMQRRRFGRLADDGLR